MEWSLTHTTFNDQPPETTTQNSDKLNDKTRCRQQLPATQMTTDSVGSETCKRRRIGSRWGVRRRSKRRSARRRFQWRRWTVTDDDDRRTKLTILQQLSVVDLERSLEWVPSLHSRSTTTPSVKRSDAHDSCLCRYDSLHCRCRPSSYIQQISQTFFIFRYPSLSSNSKKSDPSDRFRSYVTKHDVTSPYCERDWSTARTQRQISRLVSKLRRQTYRSHPTHWQTYS